MKNEKNSGLPQEATRNFRGVFAIDMLPKKIRKDESGIINFQPSNCYGSHWVCYINKPYLRNILYFDSFGISPPEKIKKYLLSSGKNIAWNSTQLQMNSSVLCGHYCIYVIINVNRGKDFYDILYSFKQIPCRLNEKRFAFALS
jgi:hypothetical protein